MRTVQVLIFGLEQKHRTMLIAELMKTYVELGVSLELETYVERTMTTGPYQGMTGNTAMFSIGGGAGEWIKSEELLEDWLTVAEDTPEQVE